MVCRSELMTRRAFQIIGDVQDLDVRAASLFKAGTNLQDASRIGCDDDLSPAFEDVLNFSALQPFRHGRLSEVVTAGAAATDIGFGHFYKMCASLGLNQLSRCFGDPL